MQSRDVVRVAALSDTHYTRTSQGTLTELFAQISDSADVLVLAGDLTDFGLPEEAEVLAKDLNHSLRIPAVGVLGNHDFEAGQEKELTRILGDAGLRLLDGDSTEIHGVGFAGCRGFCGGFGRGALGAWGEPVIKAFVHEAINEALKLETALAHHGTQLAVRAAGALWDVTHDLAEVTAAYEAGLADSGKWNRVETISAIADLGEDAGMFASQLEQLMNDPAPEVRDRAGKIMYVIRARRTR